MPRTVYWYNLFRPFWLCITSIFVQKKIRQQIWLHFVCPTLRRQHFSCVLLRAVTVSFFNYQWQTGTEVRLPHDWEYRVKAVRSFDPVSRSPSTISQRLPQIQQHTRNSAIAHKPRDAFVQMQWHGWPPKTRPSPCVLPCRNWSFCVKGCRHTYRRNMKIGERWNSALLEWEAWLGTRISPTYVRLPRQIWQFCDKGVQIKRKEHPKLGSAWAPPPCRRAWLTP